MTVAEKARIFGHRPEQNLTYTHPERETMRGQLEKVSKGRVM